MFGTPVKTLKQPPNHSKMAFNMSDTRKMKDHAKQIGPTIGGSKKH